MPYLLYDFSNIKFDLSKRWVSVHDPKIGQLNGSGYKMLNIIA